MNAAAGQGPLWSHAWLACARNGSFLRLRPLSPSAKRAVSSRDLWGGPETQQAQTQAQAQQYPCWSSERQTWAQVPNKSTDGAQAPGHMICEALRPAFVHDGPQPECMGEAWDAAHVPHNPGPIKLRQTGGEDGVPVASGHSEIAILCVMLHLNCPRNPPITQSSMQPCPHRASKFGGPMYALMSALSTNATSIASAGNARHECMGKR